MSDLATARGRELAVPVAGSTTFIHALGGPDNWLVLWSIQSRELFVYQIEAAPFE